MADKLALLTKLLNDDDQETLKYVSMELIKHGEPARIFLSEEKYLSQNSLHLNNIETVIHQINLKTLQQQLKKYQEHPNKESLHTIWQRLDLLYNDNENNFKLYEELKNHVIQRAWLFMKNEHNVLQAISVLHCLLVVNLDLKTIGDFGVISLDPTNINIPNDTNIIKHINLSLPTFFQILKEGYKINVIGLSSKNKSTFNDFFFGNMLSSGRISYYLYLQLVQELLSVFSYQTEIVVLYPLQYDEEKSESKLIAIPNFFLKTDNLFHSSLQLYDVAHHRFIPVSSLNNEEQDSQKRIYTFDNELLEGEQILFSLHPIPPVLFLKETLDAMQEKAPEQWKEELKTMARLLHR